MNTSSNSRFLTSTVNPSLPQSIRDTTLPSFYAQDDGSLSSATSTTRGRRRFRRIRSPPQQTLTGDSDFVNESTQTVRRNEWITTGISEVAIRIKDDGIPSAPIVRLGDQALQRESCNDIGNSDESSISSLSSHGDVTIQADTITNDASETFKEQRNGR